MHGAFVYDIGLLLFGLPAAIYLCWRLSEFVEDNLGVINAIFFCSDFTSTLFS